MYLIVLLLIPNFVMCNVIQMSFDFALNHPFAPAAKGARIPDQHSFPTVTFSTTANFTVMAPPTGAPQNGTGDLDFWVTPNPINCIGTSYGFVAAAPEDRVLGLKGGPVQGVYGQEYFDQDSTGTPLVNKGGLYRAGSWGGITTTAALKAVMSDYRVVGFGCRIRSLLAPLNQSGQFMICAVPSPEYQPPAGVSRKDDWLKFCNYPVTDDGGWIGTQIIQQPTSDINMYAELTAEGGMEWSGRLTGPSAFKFKDSDFGSITVANAEARAGSTFMQAAGQTVGPPVRDFTESCQFADTTSEITRRTATGGDPAFTEANNVFVRQTSSYQTGGWSSFFCRGTGIAANNQAPDAPYAVFGVEITFHFEGAPNTEEATLISSANTGVYDHAYFVRACEKNSREAWFRRIIDYAGFKGPLGDVATTVAVRGLLGLNRDTTVKRSVKKRVAKSVVRRVRGHKRSARMTKRTPLARGRVRRATRRAPRGRLSRRGRFG
jgi:hypothetical protein